MKNSSPLHQQIFYSSVLKYAYNLIYLTYLLPMIPLFWGTQSNTFSTSKNIIYIFTFSSLLTRINEPGFLEIFVCQNILNNNQTSVNMRGSFTIQNQIKIKYGKSNLFIFDTIIIMIQTQSSTISPTSLLKLMLVMQLRIGDDNNTRAHEDEIQITATIYENQ